MKRATFILPLIAAALLLSCACGGAADCTLYDSPFTRFTAESFDGEIIDESAFSDCRLTLINVWGSYCEPCKSELPALAELDAEYGDGEFRVIGIPVNEGRATPANARELIEGLGADFENIKISASLKGFIAEINVVPYSIFVNCEGKRIGAPHTGAKSKSEWKKLIDGLLDKLP